LNCIYGDCEECTQKTGSYETILKHQISCKACPDCIYSCPVPKTDDYTCECNQYYSKDQLEAHITEANHKAEQAKQEAEEAKRKAEEEAKEKMQAEMEEKDEKTK